MLKDCLNAPDRMNSIDCLLSPRAGGARWFQLTPARTPKTHVPGHALRDRTSDGHVHAGSEKDVVLSLSRRFLCGAQLGVLPLMTTLIGVWSNTKSAMAQDEVSSPEFADVAPLTPREQKIVDAFQRCNPSVVTVYDISLPGTYQRNSRPSSQDAQPEGNGSGILWDHNGHVVTNYHVLTNVLSGNIGKVGPGSLVANVFVLGRCYSPTVDLSDSHIFFS